MTGNFLNKLIRMRQDGTLDVMYRNGLISYKPIYYLDIYLEKKNKNLTNTELAERLGVTRQTIYRAIKSIEE